MSTYIIGEDAKVKRTQMFVGFDSANGQLEAWPTTDGTTFTADKVVFSKEATRRFYLEMRKHYLQTYLES